HLYIEPKRFDWTIRTSMHCSSNTDRGRSESVSPLIVNDLCAQLAPLNRYGLPSLGAAVAAALRILIGASRTAVGAVLSRSEAN
ncbi:MAG: hypothetical protein ACREDI_04035, partial [Roseiarcus sp.]